MSNFCYEKLVYADQYFNDPVFSSRSVPNQITTFKCAYVIGTLLCEPALLVKGKSFVTLYTDFSFKHLKENALVKEFPLLLSLIHISEPTRPY